MQIGEDLAAGQSQAQNDPEPVRAEDHAEDGAEGSDVIDLPSDDEDGMGLPNQTATRTLPQSSPAPPNLLFAGWVLTKLCLADLLKSAKACHEVVAC